MRQEPGTFLMDTRNAKQGGNIKMKKAIVLLLVTVLLISVIAPAFAKNAYCPVCGGILIYSRVVEDWHWVSGKRIDQIDHFAREYWEERTKEIKCTHGTHKVKEKRNYGLVTCF